MYLRNVIEEPRFMQDIDNLRRQYPRMDEIHRALTWELARRPWQGIPLEHAPDFRFFQTTAFGATPSFWVLYSYDTDNVYLHSIEYAEDAP